MALEVEVLGFEHAPGAPSTAEITALCCATAASAGVSDGHLAIEFVNSARIAQLNEAHRGKPGPTDVLSFPIDELETQDGVQRELGDVIVCPQHTTDLREAIVHGVLHLLGMDHETDKGQMLATQAEILRAHARSSVGRT
jgi:probable rRNA maturation factor